jgi:3D (Asp-Asp-Asp) domain-containing protein
LKLSRLLAAVMAAVCLAAPTAYAQEATGTSTPTEPSGGQAADIVSTDASADNPVIPLKVIDAIVTGYANGADGGAVGSITASGVHTHWGTVAADLRVYPMGTRLQIEGFPNVIFVVEDTGGGVRGNIFDVWFPELATALAFGTKPLKVTIIQ